MRIDIRAIQTDLPDDRGRILEIQLKEGERFIIGRTEGNLVLPDGGISRRHLQLVARKSSLIAEDLGSTNGTYCHGNRIKALPLRESDVLRMGKHVIVVDKIFLEGGAGTPRTSTDNESEDATQKKMRSASDFPFLQGNHLDIDRMRAYFRAAYGNGRSFWSSISCESVPLERSLMVLAGAGLIGGAARGVLTILFNPVGWGLSVLVSAILVSSICSVAGGLLIASIYHALRGFLGATGDFTSYVCFSAHAAALGLPLVPILALSSGLGSLGMLAFGAWTVWGFSQAFRANLIRLAMVWAGISVALSAIGVGLFFQLLR